MEWVAIFGLVYFGLFNVAGRIGSQLNLENPNYWGKYFSSYEWEHLDEWEPSG